jgi:hypothetical protein
VPVLFILSLNTYIQTVSKAIKSWSADYMVHHIYIYTLVFTLLDYIWLSGDLMQFILLSRVIRLRVLEKGVLRRIVGGLNNGGVVKTT